MEMKDPLIIQSALGAYGAPPISPNKELMVAVCSTELLEFGKEQKLYSEALKGFLKKPSTCQLSGQINFLVDSFFPILTEYYPS